MRSVIVLDGIRMSLRPPDIDGDGVIGGIETVNQKIDTGMTSINQPTELGESLRELNLDNIEPNTRMSGIDMRARLHYLEASSVLALDALVALKVLPIDCLAFSRQKKRLSVSIAGKGREEIVEIVGGKRELDAKKSGFGDMAKGMVGMGK